MSSEWLSVKAATFIRDFAHSRGGNTPLLADFGAPSDQGWLPP